MRTIIQKANSFSLNVNNPTAFVRSDKLFKGITETKALIHSIVLQMNISTSDKVSETDVLGTLTLESTSKGIITSIPLQLYFEYLRRLNIPVYSYFPMTSPFNNVLIFPLLFAVAEGIRPKDTYLISEKCEDYYISLNAKELTGKTYTKYEIIPYIIAEKNLNVYIPADSFIYYTSDTIQTGLYKSKLNIQGASSFIIAKNDFSALPSGLGISIYVDGEKRIDVQDFRMLNYYSSLVNPRPQTTADFSSNYIFFISTLDKKLAKISRSSEFVIEFNNPSSAFDVVCLYRKISAMPIAEVENLLKRIGKTPSETYKILPVASTGAINVYQKKRISGKMIDFSTDSRVSL
jgi:hypothetical protein